MQHSQFGPIVRANITRIKPLVTTASTLVVVIFMAILFPSSSAQARHVNFKGGTSLMSLSRPDWTELMASYTAHPRFAPAFYFRQYHGGSAPDSTFIIPAVNILSLRINEDAAQTNIYASLGFGHESASRGEGAAALAAVEVDRETRSTYVSAHFESLGMINAAGLRLYRVRAGFAPYLADFEGLHSWILLQSEYESREQITEITPLVRLTYLNMLIEMGASFRGRWQLNWSTEF